MLVCMHADSCFVSGLMGLMEGLPHSRHTQHSRVSRECLWGSLLMTPIYGTCVEQLSGAGEDRPSVRPGLCSLAACAGSPGQLQGGFLYKLLGESWLPGIQALQCKQRWLG